MLLPDFSGQVPVSLRIIGSGFVHPGANDSDADHDRGLGNDDKTEHDQGKGKGGESQSQGPRGRSSQQIMELFTPQVVPGFWGQTYVSSRPQRRVLIDDSVAMTPSPTTGASFTDTELSMRLNVRGAMDFQLAGPHSIVVTVGNNWVRAPIRIAPPTMPIKLAPSVRNAKVLRVGEEPEKWLIEVHGANLPLDIHKVHARLNGVVSHMHSAFIGPSETVAYLHLPLDSFAASGSNTLSLVTPAGITFTHF